MKNQIKWNPKIRRADSRACMEKAFYATLGHFALMAGRRAAKQELVSYDESYVSAKVQYSGKAAGIMRIIVPGEFCYKLNAGVLGIPQESAVVLDPQFDALKEFINIMCGDFLIRKFGENAVFDMTPPKVSVMGRKEWYACVEEEGTGFITEDSPVIITCGEIKEQ